jgi:DNA modification methylase
MLGEYKLNEIYNEDCYEAIKKIPDKSVDLIIIDPPYLIENTTAGGKSKLAKSIQFMNNEIYQNNLTESIDSSILKQLIRIMKNINVYIWCNHKQIPMYIEYFVTKNNCSFDIIIWNKTNAMPLFSNKYLTDKEYCLYFRKNGYCNPTNYEDAKTIFNDSININDKKLYSHPTIKPIKIISKLIRNSSKENDIVADFFLGSGTTCVAAKELNRQYIGFEIDKQYYEIAKKRLNGITADGQLSIFTDIDKLNEELIKCNTQEHQNNYL